MNWLLIGIMALAVLLVLTKFGELKHKYLLKVAIVLIVLLFITGGYVYIRGGANLTTYEGFVTFGKLYFSWLGGAFKNVGGLTGYVTTQNWTLNSTAPQPIGVK